MPHDGIARVVAPGVALPVRVVGDVSRGVGDGVVVRQRVEGTRGRVAVVGVQGHAVGAVGVDGESAADAVPDADGLDGVFLGLTLLLVARSGMWRRGAVGT